MKKIILVISALFLLVSCKKSYTVSVEAKGVKDGTEAYLQTVNEMGMPNSLDTVKVKGGKLVFEGKHDLPEFAYIMFKDQTFGAVPLVLENGNINIVVDTKDAKKTKVSGTDNNDLFQKYNNDNLKLFEEVQKFQQDNQLAIIQAQQSQDVAKLQELEAKFKTFQDRMDEGSKKFIAENKDNLITAILLKGLVAKEKLSLKEGKEYFDGFDEKIQKCKVGTDLKKFLDEKAKESKKK